MDLGAEEVLINETATGCHAEKQIKKKRKGDGEKEVAFGAMERYA